MRLRQTYIATFEAKPGMRLARPIIKVFNQRLFQLLAGTELTEDHIRQIVVRGIHCLVIEEVDPRSDDERMRDLARIEAVTQNIFSEADMNRPAIAGLYAAALDYRLQHA